MVRASVLLCVRASVRNPNVRVFSPVRSPHSHNAPRALDMPCRNTLKSLYTRAKPTCQPEVKMHTGPTNLNALVDTDAAPRGPFWGAGSPSRRHLERFVLFLC